jgi:hypothetical protein
MIIAPTYLLTYFFTYLLEGRPWSSPSRLDFDLTLPCFGLLGIATDGTNNADGRGNPTGREEVSLCFPTRLCAPVRPLPATRTNRRKQQDDEKNQRENSKATHSAILLFFFYVHLTDPRSLSWTPTNGRKRMGISFHFLK